MTKKEFVGYNLDKLDKCLDQVSSEKDINLEVSRAKASFERKDLLSCIDSLTAVISLFASAFISEAGNPCQANPNVVRGCRISRKWDSFNEEETEGK